MVVVSSGCADLAPIEGSRCDATHLCPDPYVCVSGRCKRLGGGPVDCTEDDECAIGVCLVEAGFCVQCTDNTHCSQGVCIEELYQCGCQDGVDCATGRCAIEPNKTAGYCASCYADEQCDSGVCEESTGICQKVRRKKGAP